MGSNSESDRDGRSEFAKAYGMASHILTSCIIFVLPIGIGYWLDQQYFQGAWWLWTGIGLVIGLLGGIWHVFKVLRPMLKEMMEAPKGPFRDYDESDWNDRDEPGDERGKE
ncbi:MAG TPA: AtpZ/AtpI family protein [Pirellulaceae bacterium]|nr:AtpZ/AtpI family protein [Pirellulaceae bacterium]